jgi:signal transduction histidine kinase
MDDAVISRIADAAVTVATGLELADVLQHVVEAAADLLDARYAALGVIGDDRMLAEFVHTGFDGDIDRIGHLPRGDGILGLLIRDARPLRLEDLTTHPAAVGFPEGHPPMRTFVGTPIRVRDRVYGNLYVTEKRDGRAFTEADQQLAELVAAAAGAAVDNAIRYSATRRRERSLEVVREITGEILGGSGQDRVLDLIAERALELTDAALAVICVPRRATDASALDVRAAAGSRAAQVRGAVVSTASSLTGEVMRARSAVIAERLPPELAAVADVRPDLRAIGAPVLIRGEPYGALTVAVSRVGHEQRDLVQTFANHAGVIVEYTRARAELDRLLLIEERERIGRDLHDTVIQRLFAMGLELQSLVARHADDEHLAATLGVAIDGLDDIITQIRATIFALQPPTLTDAGSESTAARVHDLVAAIIDEARRPLGFEPELVLPNDPDTRVPGDIAAHLLVVVREALSNIARHASATRASVELDLGPEVRVRVADNGVGLPPDLPAGGNGLANMRHRAQAVGGEFQINRMVEGGTVLEWRAPAL